MRLNTNKSHFCCWRDGRSLWATILTLSVPESCWLQFSKVCGSLYCCWRECGLLELAKGMSGSHLCHYYYTRDDGSGAWRLLIRGLHFMNFFVYLVLVLISLRYQFMVFQVFLISNNPFFVFVFNSHNERKVTCKHPVSGLPSQDNCIFVINEQ